MAHDLVTELLQYSSLACFMPIWQLCANLLIPNCLRSNLSYSPLAALELYVRVSKTTCCNVIYFNSASRCIPVNWVDIQFCIEEKEKKYKDYCENVKCDEYWLCICLPFEENRNLNIIDYNGKENESMNFLSQCSFPRICITPDLLGRKINWIKEGD